MQGQRLKLNIFQYKLPIFHILINTFLRLLFTSHGTLRSLRTRPKSASCRGSCLAANETFNNGDGCSEEGGEGGSGERGGGGTGGERRGKVNGEMPKRRPLASRGESRGTSRSFIQKKEIGENFK